MGNNHSYGQAATRAIDQITPLFTPGNSKGNTQAFRARLEAGRPAALQPLSECVCHKTQDSGPTEASGSTEDRTRLAGGCPRREGDGGVGEMDGTFLQILRPYVKRKP